MTTKYNEEYIRTAAYYNWKNAGCPYGNDEYFWNMAVKQLYGNSNSSNTSCSKTSCSKSSSKTGSSSKTSKSSASSNKSSTSSKSSTTSKK